MIFIGQERIQNELWRILDSVTIEGKNYNILLRGPSGSGKTFLAFCFLANIGIERARYYLANRDGLDSFFRDELRFQFVDEAHLINDPEFLYPLMDSGNYTFILATNESGELKEPLRRRCIQFIFEPYSLDEIKQIIRNFLPEESYPFLTDEMIKMIGERCKLNPGTVKIICQRLSYTFREITPQNNIEMDYILTTLLGIESDGLNIQDRIYLDFLGEVGVASLDTISNGIRIDKATIRREIEPYLVYTRKIKITSRGRELC